jgi:hypothetical protein
MNRKGISAVEILLVSSLQLIRDAEALAGRAGETDVLPELAQLAESVGAGLARIRELGSRACEQDQRD